jgi:hypothetical protein
LRAVAGGSVGRRPPCRRRPARRSAPLDRLPAAPAYRARARRPTGDGTGPDQRRHRQAVVRLRIGRQQARGVHLHQARPRRGPLDRPSDDCGCALWDARTSRRGPSRYAECRTTSPLTFSSPYLDARPHRQLRRQLVRDEYSASNPGDARPSPGPRSCRPGEFRESGPRASAGRSGRAGPPG